MKAYESLGVSAEDYLEAIFVLERHCFFRDYLIACGVDPVQAEEDACRLEHALSAESFEKLKQAAR